MDRGDLAVAQNPENRTSNVSALSVKPTRATGSEALTSNKTEF